ncbi:MAG: class I SAM-dependent methyltransferase [Myxococcota bacterium]|nr:class I SAM-dependent methyltransferase [Myxococcota bacterium]
MRPDPTDPAWLYELVHQHKDYAGDADRIHALLSRHGHPSGRLIEGACGSGSYLRPLQAHYQVAGFDLDQRMVDLARGWMPGVDLWRADLASWATRSPADVQLFLFGALCHLDLDGVSAAARCAFEALKPGGVVLVEPWVSARDFVPGEPHMVVVDTPRLKVCRQVVTRREGQRAVMDFHYLVAWSGGEVAHVQDNATLHLHDREALKQRLSGAGLVLIDEVTGLMAGCPLWVFKRPG